jgi:hypothetical protein
VGQANLVLMALKAAPGLVDAFLDRHGRPGALVINDR